jgi:site-specific DNA recombinase
MKVIGYIRVSTDEQGKSGLGLESQTEKIKAYAGLYDLELIGIQVDIRSGKSIQGRDGLTAAIDSMNQGKADGLLIAKLDRLTRSVKDLGLLLETVFNRHALLVVAEQVDTRTAAGRLVLNILTSVSEWERQTIGERTTAALQIKKAKGEKTGGLVPFGFTLADDGKTLESDSKEQATIAMIRELNDKGHSLRKIAETLTKRGIKTKGGKSVWFPQQIKNILRAA